MLRGKIPESFTSSYNSQANIDGHQSGNSRSFNSTITIIDNYLAGGEVLLNYGVVRRGYDRPHVFQNMILSAVDRVLQDRTACSFYGSFL
jgi:hypothetical protein